MIDQLINPKIQSQPIYEPGKPIDEVARQLNLNPANIAKLASNENPLGASPKAIQAAKRAMDLVHLYPDGSSYYLKQALSEYWLLSSDQFTLGNGSNEVIELIGHAFLKAGDEVVMGEYAFIVYKLITLLFGAKPVEVKMPNFRHDLNLMKEAVNKNTKLVFLPSPNNPTGTANTEKEIHDFVRSLPDHVIFCLDEAYAEYNENAPSIVSLINEGRKVIGLRTFSKIHGLAGLRCGYSYSSQEIASYLNRVREPFNVNSIAQIAAIEALKDHDHLTLCRKTNKAGLAQWTKGLEALGVDYIPSEANFILIKSEKASRLHQFMQSKGVITRPMTPYGLVDFLRISVGTEEQNKKGLELLKEFLTEASNG